MNIPKLLQNLKFRFVLIRCKDKAPYEQQWQNLRNYPYNHKRIEMHKGNLGVVSGYGNLIILDIDDLNLVERFDKKALTFAVKTGSGGRHYYFYCKEDFQKSYYVLGNKQGELRCSNSQVVAPESIHPNGNKYEVFNNVEIQNISKKEIKLLLGKLLEKTQNSVCTTDTSRSGIEWGEVCGMVESGYSFDDVDREMKLMDFTKWIESGMAYRLHVYCGALKKYKYGNY